MRSGFVGVILSAGESSRMGQEKALLAWPPVVTKGEATQQQTFLSAAIGALYPFCDMVLVVVGKNEENLARIVHANSATMVRNPSPERGQFSSLQIGLQEVLNRGRDTAIITLVDRPPASVATLEQLLAVFKARSRKCWAVVPEYQGKHGHPIIVARELIEAFLKAAAGATARDVEHHHVQHIEYVQIADPFVTMNLNTPEDYAALVSSSFHK
ncbi:MAG TPA: nucleotidyltransferase family protein [Terriglobales bacterium]|jgi:molybdenum cofactor cytidylyltransferase